MPQREPIDLSAIAHRWAADGEALLRDALEAGCDVDEARAAAHFAGGSLFAALRISGADTETAESYVMRFWRRLDKVYANIVPEHQREPWKH